MHKPEQGPCQSLGGEENPFLDAGTAPEKGAKPCFILLQIDALS
jgi:hypothetical protein